MYLLYVDESGDLNHPEAGNVVVGGLIVHEADARALTRRTESILTSYLDPQLRTLELHAQHIRKGKGPWRRIPAPAKSAIMNAVADLLERFRDEATAGFGLMAVVRSPGAVPEADPLERIYEELALRFNRFIKTHPTAKGSREHGMVVADEAMYEKLVQPMMAKWHSGVGTRFGRLTRIVEVPLFCDSGISRLVQLADFVVHALFIAYEEDDASLLDRIIGSFVAEDDVLHGLVHLDPDYLSCECMPCVSRKTPSLFQTTIDLTASDKAISPSLANAVSPEESPRATLS